MTGKRNNSSFSEDRAERLHEVLTILMAVLIAAALALHIVIVGQEKALMQELLALHAREGSIEQQNAAVAEEMEIGQRGIDRLYVASFALYGLLLGLLAYESFFLVRPALHQIARLRQQQEQMAATDLLTGAYNRSALFKVAVMLIGSARRHKQELTVLAVDIDELARVNDRQGRAGGDAAIRAVAKTMAETLRNSDVMGRIGGGEFAVFLPGTDEYRASFVAEKLRAAIEDLPFAVKESIILLRVSIGIAQMQEFHRTPDDLLRAAEAALAQAKKNGRNCIMTRAALDQTTAAAETP